MISRLDFICFGIQIKLDYFKSIFILNNLKFAEASWLRTAVLKSNWTDVSAISQHLLSSSLSFLSNIISWRH